MTKKFLTMDDVIRHETWKWRVDVLKKAASNNRCNLKIRKMQYALARSIEKDLKEGRL